MSPRAWVRGIADAYVHATRGEQARGYGSIAVDRARGQHEAYVDGLGWLGFDVVRLEVDERFPDAYAGEGDGEGPVFDPVLRWFQEGGEVELTDHLSSQELLSRLDEVPGLRQVATHYLSLEGEPHIAAAMEFVLEGLTQSSLLAREELIGGRRYRDMLSEMAESLRD